MGKRLIRIKAPKLTLVTTFILPYEMETVSLLEFLKQVQGDEPEKYDLSVSGNLCVRAAMT